MIWDRLQEIEAAKAAIKSGYPTDGDFRSDNFLLDGLPLKNGGIILDFGCGIGRNTKYLVEKKKASGLNVEIYSYDFENMIKMAKDYLGEENWKEVHWISHPLSNLAAIGQDTEFDYIIATVVFQHMKEADLRSALMLLNKSLKDDGILAVYSRGYSDDGKKNVWGIIMDYFIPINNCDAEDSSEKHQRVMFTRGAVG